MSLQKLFSMTIVRLLPLSAAVGSLTSTVFAQDLSQTVFPITHQLRWIDPGSKRGSGTGICVDQDCRYVTKDGEPVAMVIPIQSSADFVSKVQPSLPQGLFSSAIKGSISPASADLDPKSVPQSAANLPRDRSEESEEIKTLREKARLLADSMSNLVAVQTFNWGKGNKPPVAVAEYEVQVVNGFQRFREYPNGKKELQEVPFPSVNTVVVPGGEWSERPQMVGKAPHLKIHQAADRVVDGLRVKVFQYRADAQDALPCNFFKSVLDLLFFQQRKLFTVPCYGEVWTDKDFNILRISEHLELSGKWKEYLSVVTYGWLPKAGKAPQLVPFTISTKAVFKKKVYWCRGMFTNYRILDTQTNSVAGD